MSRMRPAGIAELVLAALVLLVMAVPGVSQDADPRESSPGFQEIRQQFELVDRANRPWVDGGRAVGIRIDQEVAEDLGVYLPDPLRANNEIEYPLVDPEFANRVTSERRSDRGVVELVVAAPLDADRAVPHELVFYEGQRRLSGDSRKFTATADGIVGLPRRIKVPTWVEPTRREWTILLCAFVAFMVAVTVGVYRPFYRWRLARGADVEKSRDVALFLWWLLALIGYGFLLYWKVPWSITYLVPLGILVLVAIFRLVAALRPAATG